MSTSNQEHPIDLEASSATPANMENEQVNLQASTQEEAVQLSRAHKRAKTSGVWIDVEEVVDQDGMTTGVKCKHLARHHCFCRVWNS
ncbi:hypothetical protein AQUCO_03900182v1 [Aquilegia coerulea]|uniref:Uncharacterized protein n=2 Tax=Aquilegia coerulea TaxID=218851 RepID=A0A2G5CS33_AQUCA|nr:hypothetical protein AQUCO_03900182v1 [Aquilegia coerulea]